MRKIFIPNLHVGLERWKYCIELDVYVSSYGRIKDKNGKLQSVCAKNNYLWYKGKPVHRIVMKTFNPIPNYANFTVDHKDHNTRNNRLNNLEWVSFEENQKRESQDTADNSPETNPGPIPETLFVKVNGVKMEAKMAHALMATDKKLQKNKIDSLFSTLTISKPFSYGHYHIEVCEN